MPNPPANDPKRPTAALVLGLALTAVLSGTLTIAGLKAGITPGVSPLVILFAWGAFARRIARGGGTRFLNIAQVSGSAGMAITAGVIFTAPLLQILHAQRADIGLDELAVATEALDAERAKSPDVRDEARVVELRAEMEGVRETVRESTPPVPVGTLIFLSFAGAAIGFGFVGLTVRKVLADPSLPAPEAQACRTMIQAAASHPDERPMMGRSLILGGVLGFFAPLAAALGAARDHLQLLASSQIGGSDQRNFSVDLPLSPIYIGIGGLLTLPTALLVFGGGMIHAIGGLLLSRVPSGTEQALLFPGNSMRWVGGAAMTVAVAWSLMRFATVGRRHASDSGDDAHLLEVPAATRRWLMLSIAIGTGMVVGWLLVRDGATPFTLAIGAALLATVSVMVVLGALLSLQVGASASPVSGTVFVTTLILCLVAIAVQRRSIDDVALLMPLLVGACVAVCTANDSSQDYKTMQLSGIAPHEGYIAQAMGLAVGAVVVPLVLYVSHEAYLLGSADLAAPQGTLFATIIDALLLEGGVAWWPIGIGAVLGVLAVLLEVLGGKRGYLLPSMALAVGIYLPPQLGIGIMIGAMARLAGQHARSGKGKGPTSEVILAAAGLITGAAAFELILGVAILSIPDFSPAGLELSALADLAFNPALIGTLVVLAVIVGVLWMNARRPASLDER